ncbi:VOC family protein [Aurantiacibacter spongiae]|uniref:VOC family protein n=1 Tax=Aurantiacibacter spongiae TaxID=2488860 RepID=A0A3N5D012_9SPHN|nr:VOC family protein [Aurantiacibacter spongiae]RPF72319.1 VOC family protein [Aurantiacibacter spongiae]
MAGKTGSLIRYELMTPDPDAAKTFYGAVVGWNIDTGATGDSAMDYRMICRSDGGDRMIGAVMNTPPSMPRLGWTYSFGVDDIDRAASAVNAGGGTVAHGPDEIPGGAFSAVCIDPHGATFGLVGPRLH